jgi:hypothetical protein
MEAITFQKSQEEHRAENLNGRVDHLQRLAAVLGNGEDWEYQGECIDLEKPEGKCACGHSIRYQFILHHKTEPGRTAPVGRVCIENYSMVRPEVVARIRADEQKLIDQAKARIKAAKDLAAQQEIDALLTELNEKYWTITRLIQRKYRSYTKLPYELYMHGFTIERVNAAIDNYQDGKICPFMPRFKIYKVRNAFKKAIEEKFTTVRILSEYLQ